tara:strand:+ start:49234 stop:50490 length:1257 start_codon:yes stop_codon:yes gene_type:complete
MLALQFAAVPSGLQAQDGSAQVVVVAGPQELSGALRAARTSEVSTTLQLQPGVYPPFNLKNVTAPLRLEAANPDEPPRLTGLIVTASADVSFANIVFDFVYDAGKSKMWTSAFQFENTKRLVFDRVVVDGDLMTGSGTDGDGYPAGRGLSFKRTQNVTITDSEISGFWVGLSVMESSNFTLTNTQLYGMRKDILILTQVQDVTIDGNYFGAFNRSFAFDDHPDMIQMWTGRTTAPSERVTIRNNVFNSGLGPWSQTIFFANDKVSKGEAGPEMYFRDLVIENNMIINGHLNGLVVGETQGLRISNNTLVRNFKSNESGMSDALATPRIRVAGRSRDVVIERNVAASLPEAPVGGDWNISGNAIVQGTERLSAGYYGAVFVDALSGDPRDLASYDFKPDGPLYGLGLGALITRAGISDE